MKTSHVRLGARLGRAGLPIPVFLVLAHAASQNVNQDTSHGANDCTELNRTVVDQMGGGRLLEAEALLSATLAKSLNEPEQACADVALRGLAGVMYLSG